MWFVVERVQVAATSWKGGRGVGGEGWGIGVGSPAEPRPAQLNASTAPGLQFKCTYGAAAYNLPIIVASRVAWIRMRLVWPPWRCGSHTPRALSRAEAGQALARATRCRSEGVIY